MVDLFTTLQQGIEKHVRAVLGLERCEKSPDSKYSRIKLTVGGARRSIGAHPVAYVPIYKEVYLDMNKDVSHACHQPLCVNPDHPVH